MDFSVTKSAGDFVKPAEPTPSGTLSLSRIDRLPVLRCYARTLHVFEGASAPPLPLPLPPLPPHLVIREALSKALVPYYPLAGRLHSDSTQGELLEVECTAEGVWFVQASANCQLKQVGYFEDVTSIPPHKLLPHHPDPAISATHDDQSQIHHPDPLVLMQVTEFEGDGFVMGLSFCHSICDGLGAAQFLNAIGEFARGLPTLILPPVWHRDFLPQPAPLQLPVPPPPMPTSTYQLEHANFDIPLHSINQLKAQFCHHSSQLTSCSAFEVVAASLWSHRTRAIYNSDDTCTKLVKLVFFANCRQLLNPPLPKGFYGNCFFPVTVTTSSQTLVAAPISDVIKMIQEAKSKVATEFGNWVNNYNNQEDPFAPPDLGYATLFISEWGRLGFNQVDYGHGVARHVVPVQGSSIIPVAIVGSLPYPNKGIRLMTWCVDKPHLQPLLRNMMSDFNY